MLAVERRNKILELLRQQGIVTVLDLSKLFDVSEETIRRDLQKMEASDGVARTYGGAFITKAVHSDIPIQIREGMCIDGKEAMAELADGLVEEGETIILDSSTTALHIANRFKARRNLIVITNAVKIALTLADNEGIKVICTGGTLRSSQLSFVGPAAVKSLGAYYADKAFVSCRGFDFQNGITDSDEQEAEVRKKMLEQAQKKILVADATKFGKTSFSLIASMDAVGCVITDEDPGQTWLTELEAKKIRCMYRGK